MHTRSLVSVLFAAVVLSVGCSSTSTGTKCASASECYPGIDAGTFAGPVECIDKAPEGYCTHECVTDADCCTQSGECPNGLKQVCAPFESTGKNYCFLSCEAADIAAADSGITDANAWCAQYTSQSFTCRSTGGGTTNKKVCF